MLRAFNKSDNWLYFVFRLYSILHKFTKQYNRFFTTIWMALEKVTVGCSVGEAVFGCCCFFVVLIVVVVEVVVEMIVFIICEGMNNCSPSQLLHVLTSTGWAMIHSLAENEHNQLQCEVVLIQRLWWRWLCSFYAREWIIAHLVKYWCSSWLSEHYSFPRKE